MADDDASDAGLGRSQTLAPGESLAAGQSFEEFFRANYTKLAQGLFLTSRSRADAEDTAQEAFARVCERWGRVKQMDSPAGYLYRVALNLEGRRVRRAARFFLQTAPEDQASPSGSSDTHVDVVRAVRSLPRAQRQALMLVHWLDLPTTEAADVLGVDAATVRSRLFRARDALKERLGTSYEQE